MVRKISQFLGLGRRKKAVARVYLRDGNSKESIINKQPINQYFPSEHVVKEIFMPLTLTGTLDKYKVISTIRGGGFAAQGDALKLAIAKALLGTKNGTDVYRPILKKHGLLTTDSRIKERKKYGLKKARKASQFSKR